MDKVSKEEIRAAVDIVIPILAKRSAVSVGEVVVVVGSNIVMQVARITDGHALLRAPGQAETRKPLSEIANAHNVKHHVVSSLVGRDRAIDVLM